MIRTERGYIVAISLWAFVVFAPGDTFAQTIGAATQNPLGPFAVSVERRLAEQNLRALPLKLRERRERNLADPKILEQMNEDFVGIQVARADMIKTFTNGELIDPGNLRDLAADIKRRASRLRSMLALAEESETDESRRESAKTVEGLNDQAFNLCIEISRFTENPIFKPRGVYTLGHANAADRSLGVVISLAESIRKDSEYLRKK